MPARETMPFCCPCKPHPGDWSFLSSSSTSKCHTSSSTRTSECPEQSPLWLAPLKRESGFGAGRRRRYAGECTRPGHSHELRFDALAPEPFPGDLFHSLLVIGNPLLANLWHLGRSTTAVAE